jgi:hypothetical protein
MKADVPFVTVAFFSPATDLLADLSPEDRCIGVHRDLLPTPRLSARPKYWRCGFGVEHRTAWQEERTTMFSSDGERQYPARVEEPGSLFAYPRAFAVDLMSLAIRLRAVCMEVGGSSPVPSLLVGLLRQEIPPLRSE